MALGSLLFRIVRIPKLRVRLWKLAYELFPKLLPDANWWFMNYGYEPSDAERKEFGTLDESQFQWRSRAMYHYLAARSNPAGKDLIEVGSGRGGGLRHVATTMGLESATGLDFARSAIDFCHRSHKGIPVTYLEGDGMNMPFEDLSFDLVLNVESCHGIRYRRRCGRHRQCHCGPRARRAGEATNYQKKSAVLAACRLQGICWKHWFAAPRAP